ncbi:hypothetical protein BDZ94DRAFT_1060742 [Collybia nuda]|uniref:Uncharacterized protein n=1 Tax=Collybia nuda TaxID=64659 RepID=A0A9P5XYK7_9AGAR|nr:hypothetical protein BDZ94DRAFT_1060742 [Collybia nuda]
MSSTSPELSDFHSKPTVSNAFRAWLVHAQTTMSGPEYESAKNFARAFQIWFDKECEESETSENTALDDISVSGWCLRFVEDVELPIDPVHARLYPETKTTHVARNCRHMVNFLVRLEKITGKDILHSSKECALLIDINRIRRALWVLWRYELFLVPKVGSGKPLIDRSQALDGNFRITSIGESFVIAYDTKGEAEPVPLKIQAPRACCSILRVGDTLGALIRPAGQGNYWAVVAATDVESRLHNTVGYGEIRAVPVDSVIYKKRSRALAKVPIPQDAFDNEVYSEEWFAVREKDFGSDDEVKLVWECDSDEG